MAKVIERAEESRIADIDATVRNKFSWKWLEKSVETNGQSVLLGEFIRKVDQAGKALCTLCNDMINYGSRGCCTIVEHSKTKKHLRNWSLKKSNPALSKEYFKAGLEDISKDNAKLSPNIVPMVQHEDATASTYGIHPMYVQQDAKRQVALTPNASLQDRISHQEVRRLKLFLVKHSIQTIVN